MTQTGLTDFRRSQREHVAAISERIAQARDRDRRLATAERLVCFTCRAAVIAAVLSLTALPMYEHWNQLGRPKGGLTVPLLTLTTLLGLIGAALASWVLTCAISQAFHKGRLAQRRTLAGLRAEAAAAAQSLQYAPGDARAKAFSSSDHDSFATGS